MYVDSFEQNEADLKSFFLLLLPTRLTADGLGPLGARGGGDGGQAVGPPAEVGALHGGGDVGRPGDHHAVEAPGRHRGGVRPGAVSAAGRVLREIGIIFSDISCDSFV